MLEANCPGCLRRLLDGRAPHHGLHGVPELFVLGLEPGIHRAVLHADPRYDHAVLVRLAGEPGRVCLGGGIFLGYLVGLSRGWQGGISLWGKGRLPLAAGRAQGHHHTKRDGQAQGVPNALHEPIRHLNTPLEQTVTRPF